MTSLGNEVQTKGFALYRESNCFASNVICTRGAMPQQSRGAADLRTSPTSNSGGSPSRWPANLGYEDNAICLDGSRERALVRHSGGRENVQGESRRDI